MPYRPMRTSLRRSPPPLDGHDTDQQPSDEPSPPNAHSMVSNLDVTETEADLILREISTRASSPDGIPRPSTRHTPIDEASGRDRIFAMAFPTLYPTGRADINARRLRTVSLQDCACHLMRFLDGRFGRHPRWRF